MSESTNENETSSSGSQTGDNEDTEGAITDDQLPDDLRPDKNPLAAEPDDDEDSGISAPGAEGAGGAGQPG
jgi:hypothetical protein